MKKATLNQCLVLTSLATLVLFMVRLVGFNGGSVLAMASKESADAVAMVFLNTNAAAAGGVIGALLLA
jgi:Amt family ammonium transporter